KEEPSMARLREVGAWLCSSFGVALLLFSLLLVPQSQSLADDGGGGTAQLTCIVAQCGPNPPPEFCRAFGSGCAISAHPCKTQPPNVCDGCSCQPDIGQKTCSCK